MDMQHMIWIFFAIAAHFFWALVNIGDKYIIGNRVRSPYVYLVWLNMVGVLSVTVVPFIDFFVPDAATLLWIAAAGALFFFGGFPYVKAVQIEEISRINIWWNLIPLFSLLFGWFFLGESFTLVHLVPFVFLLAGAFVASIHSERKIWTISPAFLLMVIACIAFTLYAVILRRMTQTTSFANVYVWLNIFMFFFALTPLLFKAFRRSFFEHTGRIDASLLGAVFGVSVFEHTGVFFNIWALSLGPVAYVYAMEGFQVIFVFLIATGVTLVAPRIFREALDRKNLLLKIAAMLLMIIGVVILSFQQ
jgi:drug/metabolite transporter (DMT)-like permease